MAVKSWYKFSNLGSKMRQKFLLSVGIVIAAIFISDSGATLPDISACKYTSYFQLKRAAATLA